MLKKIPLLSLLLVGFAHRLYRLGAESLWYDETVSAVLAQKSIADLIGHTARDIHPPGYYLLLHFWRRLAGESEFALAYFSLLLGILLIALIYALARRVLPRHPEAALIAAALATLAPYQLWYSQEVRMYTLGAALGVGSVLAGLTALRRPDSRLAWAGYVLTASLGLYSLYYFGFLLVALNVAWLALFLRTRRHLQGWFLANVSVVLLYLPWLPIAWRQATAPPVPPWRSTIPLPQILLESWTALSLGESITPAQSWPILLITALLTGLGLVFLKQVRGRKWAILLPTLTFGPLIIILSLPLLTGSPLYHVRYVFTYAPAMYVVLGAGWAGLIRRERWGRLLGLVAGLLWLVGAGWATAQYHQAPRYASDDLRGGVEILAEQWRPGDVILVNAGYTYTALRYYWPGPQPRYSRLLNTPFDESPLTTVQPLVLQTGTVDGPNSLGWGDPQSDFYAMTAAETISALEQVSQHYERLWLLRAYDTVTDPSGLIRDWLSEHTQAIEDVSLAGPSFMRVQGFLLNPPSTPPIQTAHNFDETLILRGYTAPASHYQPGNAVFVALWWEALPPAATREPLALSLKLWDEAGNLAAQHDEWPAGGLYHTPQWPLETPVRHPMRLDLPAGLPPGQYWLDVEVYQPQNGQSLPLINEPGHVVTLGGFNVSR